MWRLLPAFLVVNMVTLAIARLPSELPWHFWLSNVGIIGYSTLQDYRPLVPAWSLDIELQFYILVPLLFMLAAKGGWWWRGVIWAAAVLALGCVPFLAWPPIHSSILNYTLFFFAGVFASQANLRVPAWAAILSVMLGIGTIAIILLMPEWRGMLLGGMERNPMLIYNAGISALIAVFFIPFALSTVTRRADGFDRVCGDLSYVVYLLHWPALALIGIYGINLMAFPARMGLTALVVAGVYVAGYIIWRFIDRPLNDARGRYVERQVRPKVA